MENENNKKNIAKKEKALPYDPAEPVTLKIEGCRYSGETTIFTTEQPPINIVCILSEIISGDEVVTIKYKDGTQEYRDSSDCRYCDFYDSQEILTTDKEIEDFITCHLHCNAEN